MRQHKIGFLKQQTLSADACAAIDQLFAVLDAIPLHMWPEKSLRAQDSRQKNSAKNKKYCVLQSVLNEHIKQELLENAFLAEAYVCDNSGQRFDFIKALPGSRAVAIEVDFGYTASLERNLLKFMDAYSRGLVECGGLVLATNALAARIASGVLSYEASVNRLREFDEKTIPVPSVIIGMNLDGREIVDWSRSQLDSPQLLSNNDGAKIIGSVVQDFRQGVLMESIAHPEIRSKATPAQFSRALQPTVEQHALFLARG